MPWSKQNGMKTKSARKESACLRNGRRRITGKVGKDQRALSSLITVAGIMAIAIMVLSAVLNTLVPQWAKEKESEHMDEALTSYLDLRVNINNLIDKSDFDMTISPRLKLGTSGSVPLGVIPNSGKLTFNPLGIENEDLITNLHDPLSIYGKGGGNLNYDATNFYFGDQTIVYEHGAVIVAQDAGSTMKAGPELSIVKYPLLNDSRYFGYFDPGSKEDPSQKAFSFSGQHGNVTLSYEIFDIDIDGEVLIKLNRQVVASTDPTGNDKWSGTVTVDLPGDLINDFDTNILEFNHSLGASADSEWGIRNVSLGGSVSQVNMVLISLIGFKEDVGGRDSHTIHAKLLAQELNSYAWPAENLTLNFTTKYPEAWEDYFNNMMNSSLVNFQWSADRTITDYYISTRPGTDDDYIVSLALKEINRLDCTIANVRIKLS